MCREALMSTSIIKQKEVLCVDATTIELKEELINKIESIDDEKYLWLIYTAVMALIEE